jgi:hypothetical protein
MRSHLRKRGLPRVSWRLPLMVGYFVPIRLARGLANERQE